MQHGQPEHGQHEHGQHEHGDPGRAARDHHTSQHDHRVVRVVVPAALEYVRIVRLATSGVASHLGFDVEEIEDLRVAVDELASIAIEHAGPHDLEIAFTAADGELRITGRVPAARSNGTVAIGELTEQILAAVTDGHELAVHDGNVVFRCTRHLPAS